MRGRKEAIINTPLILKENSSNRGGLQLCHEAAREIMREKGLKKTAYIIHKSKPPRRISTLSP
jgi:hypothetical protein